MARCEAIGKKAQPLLSKRRKRRRIEAVARRDKQTRTEAIYSQNLQARTNPRSLSFFGNSRKFTIGGEP